jgi:phosphoribosylanthranilate isomerase
MTARVRVKICGLTRPDDAALAVSLGASALGFIFWPSSPRHVSVEVAQAMSRATPAFVTRVGVFVNTPAAEVADVVARVGLDVVQLHGDERLDHYADVGARIVKVVSLEGDDDVEQAMSLPVEVTPLVDAVDRARRGGTGRVADWQRAGRVAALRPLILAGGLTAGNIADAIRQVRPWAVDTSSGVESAPGIKSADRLREFFQAIAIAEAEGL